MKRLGAFERHVASDGSFAILKAFGAEFSVVSFKVLTALRHEHEVSFASRQSECKRLPDINARLEEQVAQAVQEFHRTRRLSFPKPEGVASSLHEQGGCRLTRSTQL